MAEELKAFKREDRYIVIKRSDLEKIPNRKVVNGFLGYLADVSTHSCRIPQREFLVIESDWPEYPIAWKMIESRVTGAALTAPAPNHSEQVRVVLPKPLERGDAEAECGEYGGAMARGYSAYERQLIRLNPGLAFASAPSAGSQREQE